MTGSLPVSENAASVSPPTLPSLLAHLFSSLTLLYSSFNLLFLSFFPSGGYHASHLPLQFPSVSSIGLGPSGPSSSPSRYGVLARPTSLGGRLTIESALYLGDDAGMSIAIEVGSEPLKETVQHMVVALRGDMRFMLR